MGQSGAAATSLYYTMGREVMPDITFVSVIVRRFSEIMAIHNDRYVSLGHA